MQVRFCTHPKTMRRFEQKFVVMLFVLSLILTNPYGSYAALLRLISPVNGTVCEQNAKNSVTVEETALVRMNAYVCMPVCTTTTIVVFVCVCVCACVRACVCACLHALPESITYTYTPRLNMPPAAVRLHMYLR